MAGVALANTLISYQIIAKAKIEAAEKLAKDEARAAAVSKLVAFGLTEDEIAALRG